MARRYDSKTTTFSPEGRLFQVEYALEAINNAPATLGILAQDGIILAADSAIVSKLLDREKEKEKIYQIDSHVVCAVAGWTADANILISHARVIAQQYLYAYGEPQPVEALVTQIADVKQSYTQFGGLRPFGASFLFAGYDEVHGFQLYQTDPAGKYTGWKATAIGQNNQSAQSILRQDWQKNLSIPDALDLAAKVLVKIMNTATDIPAERLEFAMLKLDEATHKPTIQHLTKKEITNLMQKAVEEEQKQMAQQQKNQQKDF